MPHEFQEPGKQLTGLEHFNSLNESRVAARNEIISKREHILLNCIGAILANPQTKLSGPEAVKSNVALATSYTNEIIRRFLG